MKYRVIQIVLLGQRVKEKGFGPIGFGFSAQNLFLVRSARPPQFLCLIGLLLVIGSGCTSMRLTPEAVPTKRQGFLDRIESASSRATTRNTRQHSTSSSRRSTAKSQANNNSSNNSSSSEEAKEIPQTLARSTSSRKDTYKLGKFGFRWPLQNPVVTSNYGKRGKDLHEGLDLKAPTGTPVYSSQSGVVLFAGEGIRGYGLLVVVRHPEKVSTIYAHNSKILVRRGQRVRQGQLLSYSGATGHVTGPHLHFEIRLGLSAVNPTPYLPSPSRSIARSDTRRLPKVALSK